MEYLHNFLKFVIQRCNINMKDSHELIKNCEHDYFNCDDYLLVIVYGNLLKIGESYKPHIRMLVKEVYAKKSTALLKDIYTFTYTEKEMN